MQLPDHMPTLCRVLNRLQEKGLANEIRWTSEGFRIPDGKAYQPSQMTIVKVYRFEELKDPGDQNILYLLQAPDGEMGYILDAYGMYSSHDEDGFDNALRMVPEKSSQEQQLFEL